MNPLPWIEKLANTFKDARAVPVLREQVNLLRIQKDDADRRAGSVATEASELRASLAQSELKVTNLQTSEEQLKAENQVLRTERDQYEARVEHLEKEVQQLRQQLQHLDHLSQDSHRPDDPSPCPPGMDAG
ncbi:MAG: hypothetical protein AB1705_15345 [Verrucomicrobiota bacterium]